MASREYSTIPEEFSDGGKPAMPLAAWRRHDFLAHVIVKVVKSFYKEWIFIGRISRMPSYGQKAIVVFPYGFLTAGRYADLKGVGLW
jgi:hypothetical protein